MEAKAIVSLLAHFSVPEQDYSYAASATGFIHESGIIASAGKPLYILQKFNTRIFQDPLAVFSNFKKVTPYLKSPWYTHFDWIPTKDQSAFYTDEESRLWRLLSYVTDSTGMQGGHNRREAFSWGRLLGKFHKILDQADPTLLTCLF